MAWSNSMTEKVKLQSISIQPNAAQVTQQYIKGEDWQENDTKPTILH
jgi:hypothetical protein